MIIVTGGFGFIGSNLIRALNARGVKDIIVVDDIEDGRKFNNLTGCIFRDFYNFDQFFQKFSEWDKVQIVFHEGAISSTTEMNGRLLMDRNFDYSVKLLNKAIEYKFLLQYASSASVYGTIQRNVAVDETAAIIPLNPYAFTKALFDNKVITLTNAEWFSSSGIRVQGLRYFNVYGPGEDHKDDQASPVTKFNKQAIKDSCIRVFEGSDNIYRDFICVYDLVNAKLELSAIPFVNGIFNLGTGAPTSFMDIAKLTANKHNCPIEVIPFPDHLKEKYQYWTCASINKLRQVGVNTQFRSPQEYILGNR